MGSRNIGFEDMLENEYEILYLSGTLNLYMIYID